MRVDELDQKIISIIHKGIDSPPNDKEFNELALSLFQYQFDNNEPYQKYCRSLSLTPEQVSTWREIPAVPTSAFKAARLATFPPEKTIKVFHTSGTTHSKSGEHHLDSLSLYHASLNDNFKKHLLPEYEKIPMLSLTPSPLEAPHSSLIFMIDDCMELFSSIDKAFFIQNDILDTNGLTWKLKKYEDSQEPILLMGTAFSFVHWIDFCTENHLQFQLNPESRIMETGGFKGKSREVAKSFLYAKLEELFNIPQTHIINEYGMTELGSQFYDNKLFEQPPPDKVFKNIPPWSRVLIIDPETGQNAENGNLGMIRIIDLSNRGSVIAVQTEDIGFKIQDGFDIKGRNPKATPRGCSLGIDEILS